MTSRHGSSIGLTARQHPAGCCSDLASYGSTSRPDVYPGSSPVRPHKWDNPYRAHAQRAFTACVGCGTEPPLLRAGRCPPVASHHSATKNVSVGAHWQSHLLGHASPPTECTDELFRSRRYGGAGAVYPTLTCEGGRESVERRVGEVCSGGMGRKWKGWQHRGVI